MGCCLSDAMPDVPQVIKPDPDAKATITAVTRRIGMFGRDFSVHEGSSFPSNSDDVVQKMWMWINKSDGGEYVELHYKR